jgi:hypothetical protein
MDFPGGSAADFRREMRAESVKDLPAGFSGDCQSDFPAESHRDHEADLRRDSQEDLRGDFRGDFDGVLRAKAEERGSRDRGFRGSGQENLRSSVVNPLRVLGSAFWYLHSDFCIVRPGSRRSWRLLCLTPKRHSSLTLGGFSGNILFIPGEYPCSPTAESAASLTGAGWSAERCSFAPALLCLRH